MYSTLLELFHSNWYINEDYAPGFSYLLQSAAEGRLTVGKPGKESAPIIKTQSPSSESSSSTATRQRSIAIINVEGVLTKHDYWWIPGMDTIGRWIKELSQNPDIGAIILNMSTPGGTVEGSQILADTISECVKIKPILAYVNEMACSGGVFMFAPCTEVWASTPRARTGSIGVMISGMNLQPYWEKLGVKFIAENSKHSPEKNKRENDLMNGKPKQYIDDVLDPLAVDFIEHVKLNRNISDQSVFLGRTMFASEALEVGLIDRIGTFEELIAHANELAENFENGSQTSSAQSSTPIITSSTKTLIDMNKYPRIAVATGIDSFESNEEGVHLQQSTLDAIEAALNTFISSMDSQALANQQLTQINQELQQTNEQQAARIAELEPQATEAETLRAQAQEQTQTIAQRDTRIQELETEVASLRRAPGADPSIITPKADPGQQSNEDPLLAKINATEDTNERMSLMREHGYV